MNALAKTSGKVSGVLTLLTLILTTTIGFIPILFIGLLKLFPNRQWKNYCTQKVDAIATIWSDVNNIYLNRLNPTILEISGVDQFDPKDWYLVVANHQSWLDIVILQRVFNRKIPVLKFFIKDQLKWIPFLGFSWWAMGCPFMKRYSKEYLAKYPEKRGKDLEATQKAINVFKQMPASIMSFIEGTRFTGQKKEQQKSPYQHLLKPKAGGVGFVISAMGQQIHQLLDVTIIYPGQDNSLWHFLSHRIDLIKVHIRRIPIPQQFLNANLFEDEPIQSEFRQWLNQTWAEKDELIATMRTKKNTL